MVYGSCFRNAAIEVIPCSARTWNHSEKLFQDKARKRHTLMLTINGRHENLLTKSNFQLTISLRGAQSALKLWPDPPMPWRKDT